MSDPVYGICHMCKTPQIITYCGLCEHWFCVACKGKYFPRGVEAVKQLIFGVQPGCCGPLSEA